MWEGKPFFFLKISEILNKKLTKIETNDIKRKSIFYNRQHKSDFFCKHFKKHLILIIKKTNIYIYIIIEQNFNPKKM